LTFAVSGNTTSVGAISRTGTLVIEVLAALWVLANAAHGYDKPLA